MNTIVADKGVATHTLTPLQFYILLALQEMGPLHAYGVQKGVARLNSEVRTFDRVNAPSVYKALMVLENRDLVDSEAIGEDDERAVGADEVAGRPARRFIFQITDAGRDAMDGFGEQAQGFVELWYRLRRCEPVATTAATAQAQPRKSGASNRGH